VEQIEIERKASRFIYLIKDTNIQFYLLIPNNNKVTMVLNIIDNINNEKIKNINDFNDKVLVVPVLNNNIINYLKTPASIYNQADNYFSNLINISYKILTHNNIIVEPLVQLNNDLTYKDFNNYFANKFKGRVGLISLNLFNNVTVQPQIINNQIQTPTPAPVKQEMPQNLDDIYNGEISIKEDVQSKNTTNKKEPGFVSYVLLGVMIAILSLIFLYILL